MYELYRAGKESKKEHVHHSAEKTSEVVKPHKRTVDDYSDVMRGIRPTKDIFAAFVAKPESIHFEAQAKDEKVLLLLRQHPIVLFKPVVLLTAGFFFPLLISLTPFLNFLPDRFLFAFNLGWYAMLIGMSLQAFLVWYFNVYLVTDERIIDVDFLSMVYKNVSTAKLDNIEDVTITATGVFASFFDFGTVLIQTAAERTEFEFENVPQPSKVAALLNELILEEEREKLEGRVS